MVIETRCGSGWFKAGKCGNKNQNDSNCNEYRRIQGTTTYNILPMNLSQLLQVAVIGSSASGKSPPTVPRTQSVMLSRSRHTALLFSPRSRRSAQLHSSSQESQPSFLNTKASTSRTLTPWKHHRLRRCVDSVHSEACTPKMTEQPTPPIQPDFGDESPSSACFFRQAESKAACTYFILAQHSQRKSRHVLTRA